LPLRLCDLNDRRLFFDNNAIEELHRAAGNRRNSLTGNQNAGEVERVSRGNGYGGFVGAG